MVYGVDLSKWNGAVDFAKLKATGRCGFAVIRVSCGLTVDSRFQTNLAACKSLKIPYAFYAYAQADTVSGAIAEANFAVSQIAGTAPLFVAYDAESASLAAKDKSTTTDIACAFLNVIKQHGFIPYLYCNRNWQRNEIDVQFCRNKGYGFWLAMYSGESPEHVNYAGICDIWQYSDSGKLNGNGSENIDLDVCYNSALVARAGAGTVNPDYCDTIGTLKMCPGMEYQFKSGAPITCANQSFVQTAHTMDGQYHLTKFQARMLTAGVGFYVNGKRVCVGVVKAPYCDTTQNFTKHLNEVYQFKTDFPIASGNSAIFRAEGMPVHEGSYYYTKFRAVGKGTAGFYIGSAKVVMGTVA